MKFTVTMIPGWGIGAIEIFLYLFISFILKQLPMFRDMNKISYYWLCMTILTGFWELSYITNYDEIAFLFESVDYVFHLAAESRIGPAIKNPLKAFEINVLGTTNVLQCSRNYNVKRLIL